MNATQEDLEYSPYLGSVLAMLYEITGVFAGLPFKATVELAGDELHRIRLEGGCTLVVDGSCGVTDDPDMTLPAGFPGAITSAKSYRVIWCDEDGLSHHATVQGSTRRFARLHAGAPPNAYVERD